VRQRVLVSAPYMLPIPEDLRARLETSGIDIVTLPVRERLDEDELLTIIGSLDGVICGDDRFTARVLEAAPRLKVISKWGTGVDSIDRDAARQFGIEVRNTPGAFTDAVADTVLGYLLCLARRLIWQDRRLREGHWEKVEAVSLKERVLGIVGVGRIGKAVVQRAIAFGMTVLGNDIVEMPASFVADTGIRMEPLDNLLSSADFVSLNCDLNPTSYHLIGASRFSLFKPSACLINTSRGSVIDEPALVRVLEDGRIAGAALDVFEIEPLPAASPLRRFENCLLAPHNANSSPRARRHVHENSIENLLSVLRRDRAQSAET
jgi:D-3-phosphoglycerate dehydrogenase